MKTRPTPKRIHKLATEFCRRLRAELTPSEMTAVLIRNRKEKRLDVCHSHDFIDSNMVMWEAWRALFRQHLKPDNDDHCHLVNEAWALAKTCGFSLR
jgi:hypothetical protein